MKEIKYYPVYKNTLTISRLKHQQPIKKTTTNSEHYTVKLCAIEFRPDRQFDVGLARLDVDQVYCYYTQKKNVISHQEIKPGIIFSGIQYV